MGRNVMPLKQRTRYKRKKCETCLKRFSLYYFPKHKCIEKLVERSVMK